MGNGRRTLMVTSEAVIAAVILFANVCCQDPSCDGASRRVVQVLLVALKIGVHSQRGVPYATAKQAIREIALSRRVSAIQF